MIILNQMIILFLLMIAGMICRKTNIFNDEVIKKLTMLILNVANPAVILAAAINPGDTISGKELAITGALSVVMYIVLMILAHFMPIVIRAKHGDIGVYKCLTIFGNIGFMGLPIVRSLFGPEALLYAAIFQLPFNILIYTYGVYVLKKDMIEENAEVQPNANEQSIHSNPLKDIMNVGVISCLIALVLFFVKIPIPSFIDETFEYLGNLTAPLSMMIIGDSLTKIDIKKLITNVQLLAYSFIRLLIIPLCGAYAAKACGITGTLLGVFIVMIATPAATMNAMFAQQYECNYKVASEGVALTTLLSVATMTIVFLILGI